MRMVYAWLTALMFCLIPPVLFGGLSFWPVPLNNLRNPLIAACAITALFLFSPDFRSSARSFLLDWDNQSPATQKKLRQTLFFILSFYLVVFVKTTLLRYYALAVNAHDFSFYDYVIPNTLWGRFMQTPGCHYCNHFGYHPTWVLFLLVPLQSWIASPMVCLLLCPLVLWGAAVPLWKITDYLKLPLSFQILVVLIYLNLYSVQRALMYDFHVEDIAPLALFAFAYAVLRRKTAWIIIFGLFFLSIKEDMPLYLGSCAAGSLIWMAIQKVKLSNSSYFRNVFSATLIISVAIFVFDILVVKQFAHQESYQALAPISEYGSKPSDIVIGILTHPRHTAAQLWHGGWVPLSLIFFLTPLFFIPTLLPILIHILIHACSGMPRMMGLSLYYGAPITPFLVLGFVYFLFRCTQRGWLNQIDQLSRRRWRLISVVFILGTLLQSLLFGSGYLEFFRPAQDYGDLGELIQSMDLTKRVCAQSSLLPQFPHIKEIFILDERCDNPDYILSTNSASAFPLSLEEKDRVVAKLIHQQEFMLRQLGSFSLYSKDER